MPETWYRGVFWLLALPVLGRVITAVPNPVGRILLWRSAQLRRRNIDRYHRYGAMALVALVAIPLPLTGVWTACLCAYALEIQFPKAFPPIVVGAVIAGVVVTGLTSLGVAVVS